MQAQITKTLNTVQDTIEIIAEVLDTIGYLPGEVEPGGIIADLLTAEENLSGVVRDLLPLPADEDV